MAEDDWDLYAIVRSCCTTPSAANRKSHEICENFESPFDCLAALTFDDEEDQNPFAFPNLAQPRNHSSLQELQDSYKPFLPTSGYDHGVIFSGQNQPQVSQQQQQNQQPLGPSPPPPPLALPLPSTNVVIGPGFNQQRPLVQQHQNQRQQLHQQGSTSTGTSLLPLKTTQSQTPRSRKKKSNQKRLILHVTAENLSNDVWAWRKYGQKPIKGSPYPRNYYRCSSSKGCAARKQVERSNTDPDMFIVSYTGDHRHPRPTHRNSLAGSTRNKAQQPPQKPKESDAAAISAEKAALCSSPLSATSLSPRTPVSAHETVGNDQEITVKAEKRDDDLIGGLLDAGDGHDQGRMGMISDDDDCDDDNVGDFDQDDDDDVLIPNMALNEDLIKGFEELVTAGGGGLISQSPALGDNFSSSVVGSGSSANTTAGGGC